MNLSKSMFRYRFLPSAVVTASIISGNKCALPQTVQIDAHTLQAKNKALPADRTARVDGIKVNTLNHTHKLPSNFPLPIYTSNVVNKGFVNTTQGTPQAQVIFSTKDSPSTVLAWYKAQCPGGGWSVSAPKAQFQSPAEKNGTMFLLHAVKGEQQATITGIAEPKFHTTVVNIIWQKHSL